MSSPSESDNESGSDVGGSICAHHLIMDMKEALKGTKASNDRALLYHTIGHWIPIGIDPFIQVKQVLSIGIWFRIAPDDTNTHCKAKMAKLKE
ncbi:hypothetical protein APHAL10511_006598 [Amanita phalloides]|nr:hypothetical protein APHAL10511_006598 [Amanita phalloides]